MATPRVAVLGCGYWGKNLVRVLHQLGALEVVYDVRNEILQAMGAQYGVRAADDLASVLGDGTIHAVVIAAPAVEHYRLAKCALEAGKDVYVEKPLALTAVEGAELVSLAQKLDRVLMVGHILEYHPAVVALKQLVNGGKLGKLYYIYSSRLNLGKLRTEENILWSFAPHDVSAILSLLGEMPERVATHAGYYLSSKTADTTLTTCDFASGVKAHIFVSWLHPFKEQKLTVVGDRKMAVFDDTEPERKLVLYSHRIEWLDRVPVVQKDAGEAVPLSKIEPLKAECEHFLECVAQRRAPRTDGASGLRVLQVLQACEDSLRRNGEPVNLTGEAPRNFFAHPTAVIDEPCEIGEGTKIWHFSHIMATSRLGKGCNLGQNVVISPGCVVGSNVKIQNNVSIYTGVELEDDVFCGPSMVFTNVANPRSHVSRKSEYQKTLVKRGASLGANSTIVCGTTIGRYAFVAAGAVVTRDVPDYALVIGVPARRAGWMCYCGVRLPEQGSKRTCPTCGRQYEISAGQCCETPGAASKVAAPAGDQNAVG